MIHNGVYSGTLTLRLKIAQKPYIVWSLGPKALKYESLEPKGKRKALAEIIGSGAKGPTVDDTGPALPVIRKRS